MSKLPDTRLGTTNSGPLPEYLLAVQCFQAGRPIEAETHCRKGLARSPHDVQILLLLAMIVSAQGRLPEAVSLLLTVTTVNPGHGAGWFNLGIALGMSANPAAALPCFDRAIALQPSEAAAHVNRASALRALGRPQEALASLETAKRLNPNDALCHLQLALVLCDLGQLAPALPHYDLALALQPGSLEAHVNRALALNALGRFPDALNGMDRAIALAPHLGALRLQRGVLLEGNDRLDQASESYREALRASVPDPSARPRLASALLKLRRPAEALACLTEGLSAMSAPDTGLDVLQGAALTALNRHEDALAVLQRCAQREPGNAALPAHIAIPLTRLRRYEEALAQCDRAIDLQANNALAFHHKGIVLRLLGRENDALEHFGRAIALAPEFADAYNARGSLLHHLQREAEALACFDRAVALSYQGTAREWRRAVTHLLLGQYATGWPLLESRWKQDFAEPYRHANIPAWLGQDDLAGKRLLVWSEGGYGDILQFCRYLPLLAARGIRTVVEIPPAVAGLISGIKGLETIIVRGDPHPLPACDFQIPMMSLPLAFGTTAASIPAEVPYLRADPQRVEQWQQRLGPATRGLRIGIAFSGNPQQANDADKRLPFSFLQDLYPLGEWFLLQTEVRPEEVAALQASPVRDLRAHIADFGDTAALMECLDLVVSTDTSVAHLAGALGRPLCVLLSYSPDWRWLAQGDACPWYPSATLMRQEEDGGWPGVIRKLVDHLKIHRST